MTKYTLLAFFGLFMTQGYAQDTLQFENVYNDRYGIDIYDDFIRAFQKDTVRPCGGRLCSDYVEDYYEDGTLLHKGFYAKGKLTGFKNYFPNGELERKYGPISTEKSRMQIYYKDGTNKSEVVYDNGQALEWTDYYANGNVEFEEEYHRSFEYLLKRNSYYENGDPEQTLELDKKRNLIYDWAEFYDNGQVKTQGKAQFDNGVRDYVKIGEWNVYDEEGNLEKRLNYVHGKSSEINID